MDEEFFAKLGLFIFQFSIAESLTLSLLWKISGLEIDVAKAIFGSSRVESAIDQIRKIYKSKQQQLPSEIDGALSQLQSINTLRNNIVHHGIGYTNTPGMFRTGKHNLAKSFEVPEELHLTLEDIKSATEDLKKIWATYAAFTLPDGLKHSPLSPLDLLQPVLDRPWLYRSPQPVRG